MLPGWEMSYTIWWGSYYFIASGHPQMSPSWPKTSSSGRYAPPRSWGLPRITLTSILVEGTLLIELVLIHGFHSFYYYRNLSTNPFQSTINWIYHPLPPIHTQELSSSNLMLVLWSLNNLLQWNQKNKFFWFTLLDHLFWGEYGLSFGREV